MQFSGPFGPFWRALCSGYFFWHGPFCTMGTMPLHIIRVSSGTSMGWINAILAPFKVAQGPHAADRTRQKWIPVYSSVPCKYSWGQILVSRWVELNPLGCRSTTSRKDLFNTKREKIPSPFPFEKPTETRRTPPNTADICDVTTWTKLAKADYVL